MLYRDISRTLALYVWGLTIPLAIPFFIAIYCEWIHPFFYPQPPSAFAFLITILICGIAGYFFWLGGKKSTGHLYRREALLLVLIVYFLTPLLGCFPFIFSKTLKSPIDAYFEMVSGLTTTGASIIESKLYDPQTLEEIPIQQTFVTGTAKQYSYFGTIKPVFDPHTNRLLTGIDAVSPALVFWRSMSQWLGGGGIIVLFVAILPALGVGGKILYQSEITGPSKDSMAPRIKETASQLWKIYVGLTLIQILLLVLTNNQISLFDAITISFSTLSTGGFSPQNGGISGYNNVYTDWIVIIFMILGSISFSLYFFCMRGKFLRLNDSELKVFLAILILGSLFATWQLIGKNEHLLLNANEGEQLFSFGDALRYGTFQIVSAQTSTGFATADFDLWPFSIQTLMLILMFVGGMAGSTAGGLKVVRLQICFRILVNKIERIFRPDAVRTYRIGNATIDYSAAMTVLCFILVAASLAIIGTFLLVLDGNDPETSLTSISCMLNNVGFAFRMAGPTHSFAFLSVFGKLLSCVWMIAGRLEYFAILMVFVPGFWRNE